MVYTRTLKIHIDAIGDKRGGFTTMMVSIWCLLMKVVCVICSSCLYTHECGAPATINCLNPYENIATIVLIKCRQLIGSQLNLAALTLPL